MSPGINFDVVEITIFVMSMKSHLHYLAGYPAPLVMQVQQLIEQGQLAAVLLKKYPKVHQIRTDSALYDYVQQLKSEYLRNTGPLGKVAFDSKLHIVKQVLGTNTRISRVQGSKLKSKNEIHIAALFQDMPPEFLRMIVVHELAHLKEREHDKAFYQLCRYMEPDYFQLEFDLRTYLCLFDETGQGLWA